MKTISKKQRFDTWIESILTKHILNFKRNFFGSLYIVVLMLIILQSTILENIPVLREDPVITLVSESLVLIVFLFDFLIHYYLHIIENKKRKIFKKYFSFLFSFISVIQLVSIFISVFIISEKLTHFKNSSVAETATIILFLWQYLRIFILFRHTSLSIFVNKVVNRQKKLLLGWLAFIVFFILMFSLFFFSAEKYTIPFYRCVYFSIITISTIGLGDVTPSLNNPISEFGTAIFGFVGGLSYTMLASIIFAGIVIEFNVAERERDNKKIQILKKEFTKQSDKVEDAIEEIEEIVESNTNQ